VYFSLERDFLALHRSSNGRTKDVVEFKSSRRSERLPKQKCRRFDLWDRRTDGRLRRRSRRRSRRFATSNDSIHSIRFIVSEKYDSNRDDRLPVDDTFPRVWMKLGLHPENPPFDTDIANYFEVLRSTLLRHYVEVRQ
jgi:hypothetical protein